MKNELIKLLGGYTEHEFNKEKSEKVKARRQFIDLMELHKRSNGTN